MYKRDNYAMSFFKSVHFDENDSAYRAERQAAGRVARTVRQMKQGCAGMAASRRRRIVCKVRRQLDTLWRDDINNTLLALGAAAYHLKINEIVVDLPPGTTLAVLSRAKPWIPL